MFLPVTFLRELPGECEQGLERDVAQFGSRRCLQVPQHHGDLLVLLSWLKCCVAGESNNLLTADVMYTKFSNVLEHLGNAGTVYIMLYNIITISYTLTAVVEDQKMSMFCLKKNLGVLPSSSNRIPFHSCLFQQRNPPL